MPVPKLDVTLLKFGTMLRDSVVYPRGVTHNIMPLPVAGLFKVYFVKTFSELVNTDGIMLTLTVAPCEWEEADLLKVVKGKIKQIDAITAEDAVPLVELSRQQMARQKQDQSLVISPN